MENNRKHLKISSAIILSLAVLTFLRIVGELLFDDLVASILPDGSSMLIVLFANILFAIIAFVFLLPQIYIGVKGLRIAKNPCAAKGHIVWAWILFILTVLGQIENTIALVQQSALISKAHSVILGLLSVASYVYYIWFANAVAKAN